MFRFHHLSDKRYVIQITFQNEKLFVRKMLLCLNGFVIWERNCGILNDWWKEKLFKLLMFEIQWESMSFQFLICLTFTNDVTRKMQLQQVRFNEIHNLIFFLFIIIFWGVFYVFFYFSRENLFQFCKIFLNQWFFFFNL